MAASDAKLVPIKNSAYRWTFFIFDADGDPVVGATGLDSERSLDAAAFADCTNEATEIGRGAYYLDLTAAEMNADTVAVVVQTTSVGAKTTCATFYPEPRGIRDLAFPNTSGRGMDIDASGGVEVGSFQNGALTNAAFAAGAIDAAAVATDALTNAELGDSAVTEIQTGLVTRRSTAQAGASTSITLDASASAIDSTYNGQQVAITSGTGVGQVRLIIGYVGATKVASVSRAWTTNPDNTSVFAIIPNVARVDLMSVDTLTASALASDAVTEMQTGLATSAALATVQADTDDIQTRLPAALVSGRMDSSVGAMAANVMTAAAAAADLTTELQAGLATSAALATVQADTDDIQTRLTTLQSDTDDIQTRLPAALVGGRIDASVGAMAADVMTAAAAAPDLTTELQAGLATSAALATVQADTDDIQSRLPAGLVGGRMDSSVGAMGADTLDATALKADAVAEIQSGLATSGSVAAVQADTDDIQSRLPAALIAGRMDSSVGAMANNVITAAAAAADFDTEIAAACAAAVAALTSAELSAVPGVGSTLQQKIDFVFEMMRNKITQTATLQTLFKDNGVTVLGTSVTDDDTMTGTFTRNEFA